MSKLTRFRRDTDASRRLNREARSSLRREKASLVYKNTHLAAVQEAIQIAQIVSQQLQTLAFERISAITSQCLSDVFDEPVDFKILSDRKRGKTEARLALVKNGHELDMTSSEGGSAVEIAAFALRLADLVISSTSRRRLIVMDEPFLALSEKHAKRVQQMITVLSKKLDIQIILITHNRLLQCGKVIKIP